MQANSWHHKLLHFPLCFWIWKVWKKGKKLHFLDGIKTIFHSFLTAIISGIFLFGEIMPDMPCITGHLWVIFKLKIQWLISVKSCCPLSIGQSISKVFWPWLCYFEKQIGSHSTNLPIFWPGICNEHRHK